MNEYPHRQPDEPALDYYERVARMADADEDYQHELAQEKRA